jgi:glycosyltransferase involved in cell wall biosynthesis
MRVLIVNAQGADLAGGGSGRYVADLARGLTARGHQVHVLAAFPVREDGASDTTVLHRTHWRDDRLRRALNHVDDLVSRPDGRVERILAAAAPELVHTCNLTGFGSGVWELARRRGLPLVHTLHDYHLLCPRVSLTRRDGSRCCPHQTFCSFRTRRLGRWAAAVSDVIAGSEHLLVREGGLFPHARPHVVRLPLVPVADRPLRPPDSPPRTIGYLGGLDRVKGVLELLSAAPQLARLGLELRLAGDGRLRSTVEAAVAPGLVYSGPLVGEEKPAFLEQTDLGIVPSTYEEPSGPPYVVTEWVASGRPVLASGRGGLAEARSLPGVLPLEPTAEGIVDAVTRLLEGGAWGKALAALNPPADARDLERWLDAHEGVYRLAVEAAGVR